MPHFCYPPTKKMKKSLCCSKLILSEIITRIFIIIAIISVPIITKPFQKIIQPEEWFLYQNPHLPDTVKVLEILLAVILWPAVAILISYFTNRKTLRQLGVSQHTRLRSQNTTVVTTSTSKNFHTNDLLDGIFSYTLGMLIATFLTVSIKWNVGRPRPDYFNRCFPSIDLNNSTAVHQKIKEISSSKHFSCEASLKNDTFSKLIRNKDLIDGRCSFPSGHSSEIFMCVYFTALYIWGKTKAFTKKYKHQSWRFCSGFFILSYPVYVAISRLQDYRHHWQDILVGSIIGIFSAHISYYLYFPKLTDDFCNYSDRQILWKMFDGQLDTDSSSNSTSKEELMQEEILQNTNRQRKWKMEREKIILNYF